MSASLTDIPKLEEKIKTVSAFCTEEEQKIKDNNDFVARLSLQSWKSHLEDLQQQLRLAREEQAYEVFELRLFSTWMEGSIPLKTFSKISAHLHSAISHASYFIRFGGSPAHRVPSSIEREIDLRLSAIGYGSTRLVMSGDLTPNLEGESLLNSSLQHIFLALNAQDVDALKGEVSAIGIRAISELSDFLGVLESSKIGAELTWPTRMNENIRWGGGLTDVRTTRKRLSPISDIEEEVVAIDGHVYELKVTGSIKVLPLGESKPVKVDYGSQQQSFIDRLHLNERVTISATKSGFKDELSGQERYQFRLRTSE